MVHFFGISISSSLLGWIIIGLLAGWIAREVSRGAGFGCLGNLAIGMVGSILGGWIFSKLGIWGGGFIYSLAAATVGGVARVLIALLCAAEKAHKGIERRNAPETVQARGPTPAVKILREGAAHNGNGLFAPGSFSKRPAQFLTSFSY